MGRLDGLRVLVVEDEPVLRAVVVRLLRSEGAFAGGLRSGEEAIELIAAGRSFDVMLVDLELPGMCGAECAHLARALRGIVQGGTVNAVVGMGGDPWRLLAEDDRFDRTLAKPFSGDDLVDELRRLPLVRGAAHG